MYKNTAILAFFNGLVCSSCLFAATTPVLLKPFYVGISGGFGSTTWRGLVPSQEKQNMALNISTPIRVKEGGQVFGIFTGYELTQYFSIEANYRHYPRATVTFDQLSWYAFEHNACVNLTSDTETIGLMAKVMLTVPQTTVRVYSSFGIASVYRADVITNQTQMSPTFGAGFSLNVTPRVMIDLGFNYTAGYGESELNPANTYIPFLYSGSIGVAYRI